ncbi:hypothetical protein GPJ56_000380 [Histomonas meleagridis]|uniref:uncharacterized protein n=1 Tax=Histomonas meleagridis TaxID=135588 RepID=UPI0035599770|nr:hypothetical protein GPJ56_000380 [Histomonas meleagridis]KAH0796580.1 hypothetical protein GO595_010473 [Histomonas meleagridis]
MIIYTFEYQTKIEGIMDVPPNSNIGDLKEIISQQNGVPKDKIKITFQKKFLNDSVLLSTIQTSSSREDRLIIFLPKTISNPQPSQTDPDQPQIGFGQPEQSPEPQIFSQPQTSTTTISKFSPNIYNTSTTGVLNSYQNTELLDMIYPIKQYTQSDVFQLTEQGFPEELVRRALTLSRGYAEIAQELLINNCVDPTSAQNLIDKFVLYQHKMRAKILEVISTDPRLREKGLRGERMAIIVDGKPMIFQTDKEEFKKFLEILDANKTAQGFI